MTECPKCNYKRLPDDLECPQCGIVYDKYETYITQKKASKKKAEKERNQGSETPFDSCPYCHQRVFKGAMKCVACGRILQTPEERVAIIEKLQAKKKFDMRKFLNWTVKIIILGILYYYFADKLIEIIKTY